MGTAVLRMRVPKDQIYDAQDSDDFCPDTDIQVVTPGSKWREEKRKTYVGGARDRDFDALTPRGLPLERGPGSSINQQTRSHDIEAYRSRTGDRKAVGRKRSSELVRLKNRRKVRWADYEYVFMVALGAALFCIVPGTVVLYMTDQIGQCATSNATDTSL